MNCPLGLLGFRPSLLWEPASSLFPANLAPASWSLILTLTLTMTQGNPKACYRPFLHSTFLPRSLPHTAACAGPPQFQPCLLGPHDHRAMLFGGASLPPALQFRICTWRDPGLVLISILPGTTDLCFQLKSREISTLIVKDPWS